MKNLIRIGIGCGLIIAFGFASGQPGEADLPKDQKTAVKIHFTFTSTYCGDDAPAQQLLDELARPKPLAGQPVFVKRGEVNNPDDNTFIFSGTSGDIGEVNIVVPPGKYYVVFDNKKTRDLYEEYRSKYTTQTEFYTALDPSCLSEWIKTPELTFEVRSGYPQELTINKEILCPWTVPCCEYTKRIAK